MHDNSLPSETIAAYDIGAVAYYSNRKVINS